uniref:AB hydrolase-1 domain-containing protein n=1 Tax=Mycena chlorophos TaxID=658473 RepID=A0ABQ0MD51_MYCCL|nr:predicted protein [Mycena chlorophos]
MNPFPPLLSSLVLAIVVSAQDFDWTSLTASSTLEWTSCYTGLQCALLEVPLDYTFKDTRNASIAIARVPATAPASEYLGPILFNPGGPGGSGVETMISSGQSFADFLGPQFDIVGFDPRGISFSTPAVNFFASAAQRAFWLPQDLNIRYPALDANHDVMSAQWAQYQTVGQQAKIQDTAGILQYITTDYVAHDMLRITQAFGYEKLQYWGVSYGTALGQTFATLFPDNVGRIVIDGVMDVEAWFSANITASMTDDDKVLDTFFTGCFNAGPAGCAYYASSPQQIEANLNALLTRYHEQPMPVVTNVSHGVVDYSFLRNMILGSMFSPYASFVNMADRLAELEAGNATNTYVQFQIDAFECDCESDANVASIFEGEIATTCADAAPVTDTIDQLRAFYENEAQLSVFADIWALWRVWCSGYQIHRPGRFVGPAGANTSFPLLLIGNTLDPVTPHLWAEKASTLFPGSVLLTQDSPGHTSLTAASTCTHGYMAAYFQNGTLPAAGVVCEPDIALFPNTTASSTKTLVEVNDKLVNAITGIAQGVRSANKGGFLHRAF